MLTDSGKGFLNYGETCVWQEREQEQKYLGKSTNIKSRPSYTVAKALPDFVISHEM